MASAPSSCTRHNLAAPTGEKYIWSLWQSSGGVPYSLSIVSGALKFSTPGNPEIATPCQVSLTGFSDMVVRVSKTGTTYKLELWPSNSSPTALAQASSTCTGSGPLLTINDRLYLGASPQYGDGFIGQMASWRVYNTSGGTNFNGGGTLLLAYELDDTLTETSGHPDGAGPVLTNSQHPTTHYQTTP